MYPPNELAASRAKADKAPWSEAIEPVSDNQSRIQRRSPSMRTQERFDALFKRQATFLVVQDTASANQSSHRGICRIIDERT